jgi:lipopolysaccharide transport protein LptA
MAGLLVAALLSRAAHTDGGTPAFAPNRQSQPIEIHSDKLDINDRTHQSVFQEKVHAIRNDLDLRCDKMTVSYTGDQSNITHAVGVGRVKVVEGERWGTGDQADFDNLSGVLVVTGSPVCHQGKNVLRGSKITFYTGTDLMDVDQADVWVESAGKGARQAGDGGVADHGKRADAGTVGLGVDGGTPDGGKADNPMRITSEKLHVHDREHKFIFRERVHAVRSDVDLRCDQMTALYTGDQRNITHAICLGHVVAVSGQRWGTGERADFDNLSGILVVTGSPVAHQGRSVLHGSRITFYVGTDQMDVEQASAVVDSASKPPPRKKGSAASGSRDGGLAP